MNEKDKKQVLLYVAVGAIILAAIIFLVVFLITRGNDDPDRSGPGGRGGQPVRPTGPVDPGDSGSGNPIELPTPTDPNDDPNRRPTGGGGNGGNNPTQGGGGNEGTPTPRGGGNGGTPTQGGGGNGGTPTPGGGGGNGGTPTPGGGGTGGTPTPGGGGGGGTPTPGGGGTGGTPTPGGGVTGGTPTPGGGGTGGTPTPGGGGTGGTPTPGGGGTGGTPTPGGGGTGDITPTPRVGGPTPTPNPGGNRPHTTPTPGGGWDYINPDYDSNLNAYDILDQSRGNYNNGVNFGDDRWNNYLNDLFGRISPDYSVDPLNVLEEQGVELFMQMSGLFGPEVRHRKDLPNEEQRQRWDAIAAEIKEAQYRWQLEEIMIRYAVDRAEYRGYRGAYETYKALTFSDDQEHKFALMKSDCYKIVADMQTKMPNKGLGYNWNEALGVVLRNAGSPMAEVASATDNVELFMKLGNFFEGKDFDTLSYEKKQLWWTIEEEVAKADSVERLEELIVKYYLSDKPESQVKEHIMPDGTSIKLEGLWSDRDIFEYDLNSLSTNAERRAWFISSSYYKTITTRKSYFSTIQNIDYATWDEAINGVLKSRVAQTGGEVNAGSMEHSVTYFEREEQ